MFIGSYTHNIDDKNRISIPKKWVSVLGNTVILTTGLDGSIFLYNKKDWDSIYNKLSELSMLDKSSRDFSRFMLANAFEIEIDSHNRILIPSTLSAFSNINEGEIILSGVGNRIEIWPKSVFDKIIKTINKDADKLAQRISSIQDITNNDNKITVNKSDL